MGGGLHGVGVRGTGERSVRFTICDILSRLRKSRLRTDDGHFI